MQTATKFGHAEIVKSTTSSRAASIRMITPPYDTPFYLVCFGYVDEQGFRDDSRTPAQTCAKETRAMKAALKWVNA